MAHTSVRAVPMHTGSLENIMLKCSESIVKCSMELIVSGRTEHRTSKRLQAVCLLFTLLESCHLFNASEMFWWNALGRTEQRTSIQAASVISWFSWRIRSSKGLTVHTINAKLIKCFEEVHFVAVVGKAELTDKDCHIQLQMVCCLPY
eukprot:c28622_g3_i3 orf=1750-2193(+)